MSSNQRQHLRNEIGFQRASLSQTAQDNAAKLLLSKLSLHKKIQGAQHLALYLSNKGELDPMPFIHWCWQQNKCVYLPVIHPFNNKYLIFLKYEKHTVMRANKFNILEPRLDVRSLCPIKQLDIIFTPLVAFDDRGNRLGMGGGFYDRTLASTYHAYKQGQASAPYIMGIAHDCQQVKAVPVEIWDIPLPEIITPSKSYQF